MYLWLALLAAAVVLGLPGRWTHHTIWPTARVLFIPCGIMLLGVALMTQRQHQRRAAFWLVLVGLAMIGLGAHEALPGPWTALAIPGCVIGALACARACIRGERDPWTAALARSVQAQRRRRPVKRPVRHARLSLAVITVVCGFGALLAVTAL